MFDLINSNGLVLLGCGKMGSAMLAGWLAEGLKTDAVTVLDPNPSEWLKNLPGIRINEASLKAPAICLIAVKPQMVTDALQRLAEFGGNKTLFISIAAGTPLSVFESILGSNTPVIRAMPNTPAAIGKGITALIGNDHVDEDQLQIGEGLLGAIGQTVRLEHEADMDAVTALSGSGPAYIFHMIETLAAAGEAQGLSSELALKLAISTVSGAGQLAELEGATPEQLRVNVTSPQGTTEAGLRILMSEENGLKSLIGKTVEAAAARSRELGK